MIFKTLILHNFGIYKGRHEINLAPPSEHQAITLFGGLNGGGKTTFLHAIQLALYGKFAGCVTQSSNGYETVLEEFINHDTNQSEGTAIELHVQHFVEGKEETIELFRSWRKSGKSLLIKFEVRQDGVDDPVMADRWYEIVEGLLPSSLSDLFFFDGEKIQSLADPVASSRFVKKGLHDLLGLDLVSTLISDLGINERRKLIPEASDLVNNPALQEVEQRVKDTEKKLEQHSNTKANLRTNLDDIIREELKCKAQYREMGGELLDQREKLLIDRDRLAIDLQHIDQNLRELAAEKSPLILVSNLIDVAIKKSQKEKKVQTQRRVLKELEQRDEDLLSFIRELVSDKSEIHELIERHLSKDRKHRSDLAARATILSVSPGELAPFSSKMLSETETRIAQVVNHRESVISQLEDLDRNLEGMPDPEGLEGMISDLSNFERRRIRAEIELNAKEEEYTNAVTAVEQAKSELKQVQAQQVEKIFGQKRRNKVLEASQKAQKVLIDYQNKLASAHIKKLEFLILESFKQLLRKKALVDSIEIDPDSFNLMLFDASKREILTGRLSAGERQLLSVAILWGLAKASGRPIPTIIDTPLGRLDGSHREKLVENYFPHAAHQVILLSTDEEISGQLYKQLKPHIGNEYMLTFNEKRATTEITEGYEFRGAA